MGVGIGRKAATIGLLVGLLVVWVGATAPPAAADANCPPLHFAKGDASVTGSYSGTWTYTYVGNPTSMNPVTDTVTITWSEKFDAAQSDCWTLTAIGGSASESGAGPSMPGVGGDCNATISMSGDAATNFSFDQTNSAGLSPYLTQQNPGTGVNDPASWFVEEYPPFEYGDPEGVLQSSDSEMRDFCYQPGNGAAPTNDTKFTGGGCHIGPYYAGGPIDFLSFPANGQQTQSDSCNFTDDDPQGRFNHSETLQQSVTLSSFRPQCDDVSVTTTTGHPVPVPLSCTGDDPVYGPVTQPKHGVARPAGTDPNGNDIVYVSSPKFTGTDTFTYDAIAPKGGLASDPATVTVTVKKPNKPKPKPKPKKKPTVCKVPKLAGASLSSAKAALHKAHCAAGKKTSAHSSTIPKGRVITTSPKAGTTHKAGTKVALTLSSGALILCRVPKLAHDTLAAAKSALHKAHCAEGKVTGKRSAKVAKGEVIASNPTAGTTHKAGTKVALTLSAGAPKHSGAGKK